jgi:hypothetical protein
MTIGRCDHQSRRLIIEVTTTQQRLNTKALLQMRTRYQYSKSRPRALALTPHHDISTRLVVHHSAIPHKKHPLDLLNQDSVMHDNNIRRRTCAAGLPFPLPVMTKAYRTAENLVVDPKIIVSLTFNTLTYLSFGGKGKGRSRRSETNIRLKSVTTSAAG